MATQRCGLTGSGICASTLKTCQAIFFLNQRNTRSFKQLEYTLINVVPKKIKASNYNAFMFVDIGRQLIPINLNFAQWNEYSWSYLVRYLNDPKINYCRIFYCFHLTDLREPCTKLSILEFFHRTFLLIRKKPLSLSIKERIHSL